jgi:hypothetical protein
MRSPSTVFRWDKDVPIKRIELERELGGQRRRHHFGKPMNPSILLPFCPAAFLPTLLRIVTEAPLPTTRAVELTGVQWRSGVRLVRVEAGI